MNSHPLESDDLVTGGVDKVIEDISESGRQSNTKNERLAARTMNRGGVINPAMTSQAAAGGCGIG